MAKQVNDPGFGKHHSSRVSRVINKDGTFNVVRVGGGLSLSNAYHFLIGLSWAKFIGVIVAIYCIINALFALAYVFVGVENLTGVTSKEFLHDFLQAYFFSVQTFTTVGYGALSPENETVAWIASFEALVGLLGLALATGLLYGRFSKPSSRISFSPRAIVSPYRGINSLQFRIANKRSNVMMDMEARVLLAMTNVESGQFEKRYYELKLETDRVHFFPLTWTIVHPIDDQSPLWGMDQADFERKQVELLILIRGFDDAFSQITRTRTSYLFDEILWGAKFVPAFNPNDEGVLVLDLDQVGKCEYAEIEKVEGKQT